MLARIGRLFPVFLLLFGVGVAMAAWGFCCGKGGPWQSFWIGLSTNLLAAMVILAFIDHLIESREAQRWEPVRRAALFRLVASMNSLVDGMRAAVGVKDIRLGLLVYEQPVSVSLKLPEARRALDEALVRIDSDADLDLGVLISMDTSLEFLLENLDRLRKLPQVLEPEEIKVLFLLETQLLRLQANVEEIQKRSFLSRDQIATALPADEVHRSARESMVKVANAISAYYQLLSDRNQKHPYE